MMTNLMGKSIAGIYLNIQQMASNEGTLLHRILFGKQLESMKSNPAIDMFLNE